MSIKLSGETKYNYVIRHLNGESAATLVLEINHLYQAPIAVIYEWRNQYLKEGIKTFKPLQNWPEFIKRKKPIDGNKYSKEDLVEILRIYDDLLRIQNKRDAFRVIKSYQGHFSVKKLCDLIGINRSSYYSGLKNCPQIKYNQEGLQAIDDLFFKYDQIFGVRRIKIYLNREYKININHKTVHRYMQFLGLKASTRIKKIKKVNPKSN